MRLRYGRKPERLLPDSLSVPHRPPFPLSSFPFSRNYQNRGMRVNLAYCEFELKINSWPAHADLSGRIANVGMESSCLSAMIYLSRHCRSSTIVYESIVLVAF